jgi:hypothetical protein
MVESVDELRAAIDDRKRLLSLCNLPESSARRLAWELSDAGGAAAQLAVLDKWIAKIERARAMTEQMFGHYWDRAEARAAAPVDDWRPITPRLGCAGRDGFAALRDGMFRPRTEHA